MRSALRDVVLCLIALAVLGGLMLVAQDLHWVHIIGTGGHGCTQCAGTGVIL